MLLEAVVTGALLCEAMVATRGVLLEAGLTEVLLTKAVVETREVLLEAVVTGGRDRDRLAA